MSACCQSQGTLFLLNVWKSKFSRLICKHTTVVDLLSQLSHSWMAVSGDQTWESIDQTLPPLPALYMELQKLAALAPLLQEAVVLWKFIWNASLDVQTIKECPLSKCPEDLLILTTSKTRPCPCVLRRQGPASQHQSDFLDLAVRRKKTGSKNLGRGHVRPNFSFAQSYFLQEDICKMLCCHLQKQREKSFVAIFRNNKKNSLLLSAETMRTILCCSLQKQQEKPFVAICRNNG